MIDHDSDKTSSLMNAFLLATFAVTSFGLATQYVTITTSEWALKNLQKSLGILEYLEIYDKIALGYPAYEPQSKYLRDLESLVHFNGFVENK